MKILLAGSDSMEFGWLVACWVPYVRYHVWHGNYDRVVIVCRAGNEQLYKDFATDFEHCHVDGETDMWRVNGKAAGVPGEIVNSFCNGGSVTVLEPSADIINPDKKFYWYYG